MIRIPDELKMAREFALLGNYDTALVYYDGMSILCNLKALHRLVCNDGCAAGVAQALSQHIDLCSATDRVKWSQVRLHSPPLFPTAIMTVG